MPSPEAQAFTAAHGAAVPISPWGAPARFCNDFAEGTVSFVHRPPTGSSTPLRHAELLDISGPPTAAWELQIQARFRVVPQGTIWCGFELRDGPMHLSMITRGFARALLKVGRSKAQQRGAELRYAIGDEGNGAAPHIAVPLMEAFRMFRADEEVPLPVTHTGTKGTWHWSGTEWTSIDRPADFLDMEHCFTFIFNTAHIDWHEWKVVGIPALRSLDLGLFWGNQACTAMVYDDAGPDGARRPFFEMELLPPHARTDRADFSERVATLDKITSSGHNTLGTRTPTSIEDNLEEDEDDFMSVDGFATDAEKDGHGSRRVSLSSQSTETSARPSTQRPSLEVLAAPEASSCSFMGACCWR